MILCEAEELSAESLLARTLFGSRAKIVASVEDFFSGAGTGTESQSVCLCELSKANGLDLISSKSFSILERLRLSLDLGHRWCIVMIEVTGFVLERAIEMCLRWTSLSTPGRLFLVIKKTGFPERRAVNRGVPVKLWTGCFK